VAIGRKRIGYVMDRLGSLNGELRVSRFRETIEEAGLEIDPAFVFEYPFEGEWNDYNSGYAVGERIAQLTSRPDAVFAFNDLGALGLMDALLDAGIRVPEDIAIVGLDDIELASRARVPLTTVRQPVSDIGARALDTILARLRGETPARRQLLPPELVVRGSTADLVPAAVAI
jgi:DNA-binding LacI/PurR family transcriptional regulator